MNTPRYVNDLSQVKGIPPGERSRLLEIARTFAFRANEHYLSLIDWSDPKDPIRRIIIPDPEELIEWGRMDASNEQSYTRSPGLQHKYRSTAVLLVSDSCGGFCRFCFRKRIFISGRREVNREIKDALSYIRDHREITNVLLTGGDGLILSTGRLERIIAELRRIDHVRIIRIGTKLLSFNPYRVLNDPELLSVIRRFSLPEKRIYFMTHFNHVREITPQSLEACSRLMESGGVLCNQTPLIRGVNDDPETLSDLFKQLSFIGIPPYYVFICRPTVGNRGYAVPVERAFEIFQQAQMRCSGLAKRARLVMSHATGKIELVGRTEEEVYFRYHRSAEDDQSGAFMVFRANPRAFWFDDYEEMIASHSLEYPYRVYGPE
jgi:lysine 2,3-aminomutase